MQIIQPRMQSATEQRGERPSRYDIAAMEGKHVQAGAMTYTELEDLLQDLQWEPDWRTEADTNAAYYDGYQKSDEQRRLEEEGQPVAVVNLISRTVNVLLGNEAKARTSWKLSADSEEFGDVTDALQGKLTEAQRETYADMSISEAYSSQTKAGLGWVEVSRVADVFAPYAYRVKPIHRNEIWWDWRAKELDLSDARFLVRKRWFDLDELEQLMPQYADLFRYYAGSSWSAMSFAQVLQTADLMRSAEDVRRSFKINQDEWLDTTRKRILLYEVWYRRTIQTIAMILRDGTVREFEPTNPMHAQALSQGIVRLQRAPKQVLRMAIFAGPHRLEDHATKRRRFPYIPFWAFRDDQDRSPYSMVSGMRYPQDEYNARRSRLMWLLQAAQVFVDDDALATRHNNLVDLAREIMRPDAMIVRNSKAANGHRAITIERSTQLPREQADVMTDAKNLIMEQPGVSASMMGDAVPGVKSGVAYGSLVTQSNVAIGDHDDNYRYARRMVGEALVDLIVEDHQRPNMPVKVGTGRRQRVVVLNTFAPDQSGAQMPVNTVAAVPVKVGLDDAPNTPAFKVMQQQQVGAALNVAGNDPIARAVLLPAFIEATDLPNRDEYARWMREQYGVPQPGDREGQVQADQEKQEMQKKALGMQEAAAAAELADKQASAAQKRSAAELNEARAREIAARLMQPEPDSGDAAIDDAIAEAMGG